ncbi:MAG TPA: sulfite exporter TauE/SafE family protein [Candidatus Acidoferrales bacterium]|nr:sulfite exporter TauE/SafE family protein [Candidatus Acidoferrales bacterium]
MNLLIGLAIALAVGLTGIGGGSFTVPALVLLVGLPAEMSVGTAFVFAGVLRLVAAPFYLAGRHVHWRYLGLLCQGAVPGLFVGTYVLKWLSRSPNSPIIVILLGMVLTASSSITFIPAAQNRAFTRKNARWLPWLALPIGIEAGFSSAGAGALGTVLLLNYSEMTPTEVVGTDILFGLVLAVLGSVFHWKFGSINSHVLVQLLEGGLPGVILGCLFARRVAARRLKLAIATIAIFAGLQLIYSGSRTLWGALAADSLGPYRALRATPDKDWSS